MTIALFKHIKFKHIKHFLIKHKESALIVIMFLLLNLPFWLTSQYYGLGRVIFNLDYLLLTVFFYKKNKLSASLFFLFFVIFYSIELMLFGLKLFPFINFNDFLYLSTFIFSAPPLYRIIALAAIFAIIFVFYGLKNYIFDKVYLSKKSIIVLFLASGILFIISLFDNKVIRSNSYFFIKNYNASMLQATDNKLIDELTSDYLSKELTNQIKNNTLTSKKILYIVNESWSETAKKEQQQAILKPIYDNKASFEFIKQGSFSIVGSTVAGEVRELCQKKLQIMDAKRVTAKEFEGGGCIPRLLKEKNYKTYSMHGADYSLYGREYWYPLAGLDKQYFFKDLPDGGQCKAFDGRCDIKLMDKAKELLLSNEKVFVYWLTLNSHAPYDDKIFIDGFNCPAVGLENNTWVCNNYKLHYQFFSALAKMLEDPALKGVEVYVVGDHPAPVANIKEGLKAFKGSDVAWLHFKVKE